MMPIIDEATSTPQQRQWVADALKVCSFPFQQLPALWYVYWADPLPVSDARHPYMVTEFPTVDNPQTFKTYIAKWADDPTAPGVQGLPDPAKDVKDFYMQSLVHELGHVTSGSTFMAPNIADGDVRLLNEMVALFWRHQVDSGTGRRTGTFNDFSDPTLAWVDEIQEAVSECFKCAFFTGRLIFGNRTNWNIDKGNWAQFLQLLQYQVSEVIEVFSGGADENGGEPGGGGSIIVPSGWTVEASLGAPASPPRTRSTYPVTVTMPTSDDMESAIVQLDSFAPQKVGGLETAGGKAIIVARIDEITCDPGTPPAPGVADNPNIVSVDVLSKNDAEPFGVYGGVGISMWNDGASILFRQNNGVLIPDLRPPFWIGMSMDGEGNVTYGLWTLTGIEPTLGSVPDVVFITGGDLPWIWGRLDCNLRGTNGNLVVGDFFMLGTYVIEETIVPAAPYPFASLVGFLAVGAPLRGALRIGH